MRRSLTLVAAVAAAAGCSNHESFNTCPGQVSDFGIYVHLTSVPPNSMLRLCASSCRTVRLSADHHPAGVVVGYAYKGTARLATIGLSLTATHAGRSYENSVALRIPQSQFGRCGDYGGPGYASVDRHFTLRPARI